MFFKGREIFFAKFPCGVLLFCRGDEFLLIYLSEALPREVRERFESLGYEVRLVCPGKALGAVASHPDIYICAFKGRAVKALPGEVYGNYPENAAFCAAVAGNFFIHNLKITAPRLLREAEKAGLKPVHVNQGYAKCSCASVGNDGVMTADPGIASALEKLPDIEVLRLTPGHILLCGHEYGFIGGASGTAGGRLWFLGDSTAHPDHENIRAFAKNRGVELSWFSFPLIDAGGIIEII